jgi:hypothetical protein
MEHIVTLKQRRDDAKELMRECLLWSQNELKTLDLTEWTGEDIQKIATSLFIHLAKDLPYKGTVEKG